MSKTNSNMKGAWKDTIKSTIGRNESNLNDNTVTPPIQMFDLQIPTLKLPKPQNQRDAKTSHKRAGSVMTVKHC